MDGIIISETTPKSDKVIEIQYDLNADGLDVSPADPGLKLSAQVTVDKALLR